jgi:hypothetical protein
MGSTFIRYATQSWKRLIRVVYLSIEREPAAGTHIDLFLKLDLDPQAGKNQLRLAVQDTRTGLVGTIAAPVPQ